MIASFSCYVKSCCESIENNSLYRAGNTYWGCSILNLFKASICIKESSLQCEKGNFGWNDWNGRRSLWGSEHLPERWNFIQKCVEHSYIAFDWYMICFDFLLYCRHTHIEKSLNFCIATNTIPFCWKQRKEKEMRLIGIGVCGGETMRTHTWPQ